MWYNNKHPEKIGVNMKIGEKIKTLIEKLQVNSNSEQKDNIANDKKNITIGKKETNYAIKQKFIQRNKNIAG